ncbi:MAG: hypothetical protein IJ604_13090 [Prevotella sp.]|nr:hypothetical protein [Prevotella sp.]
MKKIILSFFLLTVVGATNVWAGPVQDSLNVVSKERPVHTLSLNYGVGWITSEVTDGYAGRVYRWRTGQELSAEYSFVRNGSYGFGVLGDHSSTDYPSGAINITYIAPEIAMLNSTNKWLYQWAAGLGWAHYSEDYASKSGLGLHTKAGIEYLLTRHIGIGADVLAMYTFFGKGTEYRVDGFSRISIVAGLRFHL